MEYFTAVNVSRVNTALHSCWTTHSTDSLCWSWHYSEFFSFVSLWVATMSPLPLLLLFYFTTAMPFLFMKVDNDGLFPERPETTTLVTWDPLACHSLSPAHEHAHLLRSHVHRLGFPSNRPALTFQWRDLNHQKFIHLWNACVSKNSPALLVVSLSRGFS